MRIHLCLLLAALVAACSEGARVEGPDAGSAPLVQSGEIPCEARAVLEAVCHNCHTDPPQNGAPFSQKTYADITADLDGVPVYERMRRAIEAGRMPLDPYALTEDQRASLVSWLSAGAPPAPLGTVCSE